MAFLVVMMVLGFVYMYCRDEAVSRQRPVVPPPRGFEVITE